MATTKTFNNVRLQLKYDTYTAWTTTNPVLLAGEIAITTVPSKGDGVQQVPAVLMKVGDGTTPYNELNFVSALAANVHDWAMAENKPVYEAKEITGLSDWINDTVVDTNTTYQIVKVDDYNYKLQYKELDGAWTDVAENGSIVIPKYDDAQLKADIQALQTQVGSGKVEEQITNAIAALDLANTYDPKGASGEALTSAKSYTDQLANGAVAQNTAAINAIKDGTTIDSFADVEANIKATEEAATEAANQALEDAKAYADGKDEAIQAAASAASTAQGEVDALEQVVGTPTEGKTVVGMIEATQGEVDALEEAIGTVEEGKTVVEMIEAAKDAAVESATYDDTQVKADIAANTKAISDNKADIESKLDTAKADLQKDIDANAEAIELLTNGVSAEEVDGVNDLIQYVKDHGTEVTGIKADIKTNADDIDALEGRATTLEGRADAVEGRMDDAEADIEQLGKDIAAIHTHTNLELLETYTQTEANLADAVAKKHEHANAEVLNGIEAADVAAWDKAVTDIGTVEEGKTLVEMVEDAKNAAIESASYNDTEVRGLIKTNADAIDAVEERVGTLETNAVLEGDTLILNCGTSAGITA